jgi:hypothetical protein
MGTPELDVSELTFEGFVTSVLHTDIPMNSNFVIAQYVRYQLLILELLYNLLLNDTESESE